MANPEHLEILKQGVKVWNRWRDENPDIRPELNKLNLCGAYLGMANLRKADLSATDLSHANLFEADLRSADLSEADLHRADLRGAGLIGGNLQKANLREADLEGGNLHLANLSQANLKGAKLIMANLSNTNLGGADLSRAILRRTELSGAEFNDTNIGWTIFGEIDLSEIKAIETALHQGPSTIGVDTLYRSKGEIPEVFLRGCGLSNVEIEMAKLHNSALTSEQITAITYKIHELLIDGAVHYHSCFISHSSKDEIFARKLHDDLQNKGVRCWFAPEDLKIGDKIRPAIDQSIRVHDKLLLILSENSLNSEWVESEVEEAFEEERKRKQTVLFPVRLDEAVMETEESWAAEIRRTRHIGDFSRWKDHNAYQQAFERLLRDLKAEG